MAPPGMLAHPRSSSLRRRCVSLATSSAAILLDTFGHLKTEQIRCAHWATIRTRARAILVVRLFVSMETEDANTFTDWCRMG